MRGLINFFLLNGSLGARLMVSASAGCRLQECQITVRSGGFHQHLMCSSETSERFRTLLMSVSRAALLSLPRFLSQRRISLVLRRHVILALIVWQLGACGKKTQRPVTIAHMWSLKTCLLFIFLVTLGMGICLDHQQNVRACRMWLKIACLYDLIRR